MFSVFGPYKKNCYSTGKPHGTNSSQTDPQQLVEAETLAKKIQRERNNRVIHTMSKSNNIFREGNS